MEILECGEDENEVSIFKYLTLRPTQSQGLTTVLGTTPEISFQTGFPEKHALELDLLLFLRYKFILFLFVSFKKNTTAFMS